MMAARASLVLVACGAARAQHGGDPFAGTGCNCSAFCDSQCTINGTAAPQNITLYRMTPINVDDATDKNTGDAAGDTSYVLSRRTALYDCQHPPPGQDPSSNWHCATMIVSGDDPNSTDLVIAFTVEVDGQWGPYLYCNPQDAKHADKPWHCSTNPATQGPPPNYPAECKAANFSGTEKYCYTNTPSATVTDVDHAGCCSAATAHDAYGYTYYAANQTCAIYTHSYNKAAACDDGVTGHWEEPSHAACDCPKVHQSVGRRNLTSSSSSHHGGGGNHAAGGEWYSTTKDGECAAGHTAGDGTCSWRVVGISKAVNASCVYDRIDSAVEAVNPSCFADCPAAAPGTPWTYNRTTQCYSNCYSSATRSMPRPDLVAPWDLAFASDDAAKGGCPTAAVPGH